MGAAPRSVLVFPAGMPSSLSWAQHASQAGVRVVGASSLAHDPARDRYPEWAFLPWIGDADFSTGLGRCLNEKHIDTVFTPHPVVWSVLRDLLPKVAGNVHLESERPWTAELADYRACRGIAARFHQQPLEIATGCSGPLMPVPQLAALVRMFQLTPGQCDYEKLEALIAIFRELPPGDLVEIGSLWGRSAVALAFLARHYRIGHLLCVDPWRTEELRQRIPAVDAFSSELPIGEIFDAFCMNLAPFLGSVNYSRARSQEAAFAYAAEHCFSTEEFGFTAYTGEISLLHIDGNHAVEAVRQDISTWRQWVRADGWIVFDDYCWPFGDGPKVAADEFLRDFGAGLSAAFVAGGALFVRKGQGRTPLEDEPCFRG